MAPNQAAFGQEFGVTQVTVSKWETGADRPGVAAYLRMGSLAGDPECWYFWERAGLSKSDIMRAIPGLEERIGSRPRPIFNVMPGPGSSSKRLLGKKRADIVSVPLLRDPAAAGSPRQVEPREIEDNLPVSRNLLDHPDETTCIRVAGKSMSPILEDGYIVAVDAHKPFSPKHGDMVCAQDPEGGLVLKWYRVASGQPMLVSNYSSREAPYQPILLSRDRDWKILGKVIWWMGQP